jgi:hypothetical protein
MFEMLMLGAAIAPAGSPQIKIESPTKPTNRRNAACSTAAGPPAAPRHLIEDDNSEDSERNPEMQAAIFRKYLFAMTYLPSDANHRLARVQRHLIFVFIRHRSATLKRV